MEDPSVAKLQSQLDELKNLCQTKDQDIQKYRHRLQQLRQDQFAASQSQSPEVATYERGQFEILEEDNAQLTQENDELKARFLRLLAKKNEYKKRYRQLKATAVLASPASPSGLQAENQNLKVKMAELSTALEFTTEERDIALGEAEAYRSKLDRRVEEMRKMRAEAKDAFATLRGKLDEERSQRQFSQPDSDDMTQQLTDLQNRLRNLSDELTRSQSAVKALEGENRSLHETVERLDTSARELNGAQIGFISSLEEVLGCSSFSAALQRVQELATLAKSREGGQLADSEAYAEIVDALKQILGHLSPNALNLPADSELRQLFAAICNMLNAAINPMATRSLLVPHIRSLVYQARVFAPHPDGKK
jgi:chromosome segregation ATPase